MTFSTEKLAKVNEIVARYPDGKQKSALLPVLHLAQEESGGWLSAASRSFSTTPAPDAPASPGGAGCHGTTVPQ